MMESPQLERKLGVWVSISIVVGAVIGSSIFVKPAVMASQLGSPLLLLFVWIAAGTISLIGGMINAEIGAMLPKTGGQYIYFRHMYGEFFAYVYGWASFIVINTAAIGAIAFVFAQFTGYFIELPRFSKETELSIQWNLPYLGKLFPLQNAGVKTLAILLITAITYINYRSVKSGGAVQVFFTVLKVAALILLIVFLFSGRGSLENLITNSSSFDPSPWNVLAGFIAACSGALAAYDGWNNLGFVAGEIKNPQKNIPRGLIGGLCICVLLYVATNEAYLFVLPIDEMKGSTLVAADAVRQGIGIIGGGFIAALVMISTAGAVNGNILPCARVIFALGKEKNFFEWCGRVHPRYHTPSNSLWLQCMWSCFFVLTGSFDMLTDMFVFITWIFYGFTAYGIFILRRKMPAAERPYTIWGYPVLPVIFIAFAILYFAMTLYNDVNNYIAGKTPIINSVLGLILTALGIPFYWYFKRRNRHRLL